MHTNKYIQAEQSMGIDLVPHPILQWFGRQHCHHSRNLKGYARRDDSLQHPICSLINLKVYIVKNTYKKTMRHKNQVIQQIKIG